VSSEPKTTKTVSELVELWNQAVQHGVNVERACVVLWLRQEAVAAAQTCTLQAQQWARRIDGMADAIKRGEHDNEVTSE